MTLLDCDLLVGHDVTTGRWSTPEQIRDVLTANDIAGGMVSSLRAVHLNSPAGNDEALEVAKSNDWSCCPVLELRDPLGAERELDRLLALQPLRAVRLAPSLQHVEPSFPAFGHIARLLVEAGVTVFLEGDVRVFGGPLRGLGASVVFLDTHFYHLGDFVVLAREEPGFRTSTRMLTGPDSLEIVAGEVGAERLLFGSRTPFHETRSVVRRLLTSKLSADEIELAGSQNLTRLLENA
jgi:hypothetical protein